MRNLNFQLDYPNSRYRAEAAALGYYAWIKSGQPPRLKTEISWLAQDIDFNTDSNFD